MTCTGWGEAMRSRWRWATPARGPLGLRPAFLRAPPQVLKTRPSWRGRLRRVAVGILKGQIISIGSPMSRSVRLHHCRGLGGAGPTGWWRCGGGWGRRGCGRGRAVDNLGPAVPCWGVVFSVPPPAPGSTTALGEPLRRSLVWASGYQDRAEAPPHRAHSPDGGFPFFSGAGAGARGRIVVKRCWIPSGRSRSQVGATHPSRLSPRDSPNAAPLPAPSRSGSGSGSGSKMKNRRRRPCGDVVSRASARAARCWPGSPSNPWARQPKKENGPAARASTGCVISTGLPRDDPAQPFPTRPHATTRTRP